MKHFQMDVPSLSKTQHALKENLSLSFAYPQCCMAIPLVFLFSNFKVMWLLISFIESVLNLFASSQRCLPLPYPPCHKSCPKPLYLRPIVL